MEAFEVRGEEEGGAVEFGKGVGGADDSVAEALQDALVERGEDWVLECHVLDGVFLACGCCFWMSLGGKLGVGPRGGDIQSNQYLPSISSMDIRAASSNDELSDPAVMLPKPRQTHRVMGRLFSAGGNTSCSNIRDRFLKQSDSLQTGA